MTKTNVLVRLHQHQDSILSMMRTAEPLLRSASLRDIPALSRGRWSLMRALSEYQQFKHQHIFDPAIGRAALGSAQRAERMKRACIAMGDEYRAYAAKWGGADIAQLWSTYQPAALQMIARLRDHIAREREDCAALLDLAA